MTASLRFRGAGFALGAVLVFLYVPIATLVLFSFSAGDRVQGSLADGLSLRWYQAVLNDETLLRTVRNSLTVAGFASVGATLVAAAGALGLGGGRRPASRAAEAAILAPLIVPEIVLGVALLVVFALCNVRLGLATIAVSHAVLVLPVAYVPIRARLQGLDPRLFEAAADLHARPGQVFCRVTLPLIAPGIAVGLLLAFIGSLSDVVVAFFVSGPGATTLPVHALSMVRVGVTPVLNAISTLLLALPVVLLLVLYPLNRLLEKRIGAHP